MPVKGLLTLLLAADTKGFNIKMDAAAKRMKRLNQATAIAKGALIAFGAAAAIALGADVIRTIIRFDKAMVGLSAILGKTRKEIEALEKQAIRLGGATIFTATQIGDLQTILARFGFDQSEIEASTRGITDLAAAAGIDLAQAADTGAATLRAFRLEASEMGHVADVMTNAFTKSALTVLTFADAMTYAAPIAASTNVSLEETAGALAILADNGIRGSVAGTGLRRILVALGGEGRSIADIMEQAALEIEEVGNATKYAKDQVGLFAIAPFLTLIENAGKIRNTTMEMDEFGSASKVAAAQLTSIENKTKLLDSAWKGLILTMDSGQGMLSNLVKAVIDGTTDILILLKALEDFKWENIYNILSKFSGIAVKAISPMTLIQDALINQAIAVGIAEKALEDYNNEVGELGRSKFLNMDGFKEASHSMKMFIIQQQLAVDQFYLEADEIRKEAFDKEQKRLKTAFDTQNKKLYRTFVIYDAILKIYKEIKTLKIPEIPEDVLKAVQDTSIGIEDPIGDPLEQRTELRIEPTEFPFMFIIDNLLLKQEKLKTANDELIESYKSIGLAISGAFMGAAQSLDDFAIKAINSLIDIAAQYAINAAVAAVAAGAQSASGAGVFALIALPVAIGIAAGLVKTALNSARSQPVTAFADGGIISGTTYGVLGEYASAGRDPEVVAPLSKLTSLLDVGGGQRIYGEFVLKKKVLVAAVNTENDRRNRYGG